MDQERNKHGKFIQKDKEPLEKVIGIRVTKSEFEAINEAKKNGAIDPRKVLVETVKKDSG